MAEGRSHPQPGDLIEIHRGVYQHWALYVGDGYVIHVTGEAPADISMSDGLESYFSGNVMVKKEVLKDVVKNHKWRVNNKYDRTHTPLPVEKIIQNAESLIDVEIPDCLSKKYLEQFVIELRYKNLLSDEGDNAVGCCIILLFVCCILHFLSKDSSPAREEVQNHERELIDDYLRKKLY